MTDADERLMSALVADRPDLLEEAIADGANVNATRPTSEIADDREPVLFLASRSDEAGDLMQYLLDHGADPEARATNGDTLLHETAGAGYETLRKARVVRRLLEAGVNINATDNKGRTALDRAIRKLHAMFSNPRERRCEDCPDLVVGRHIIDLLQKNGGRMNLQESRLKLRELEEIAERELRVDGYARGHG